MLIKVKVFPKSKKEEIIMKDNESFEIKIKAKAKEGKANESVVEKLASHFAISPDKIRIVRGHKFRKKLIEIKK
jgi:uncharacterized protein (TIGR00251 family)